MKSIKILLLSVILLTLAYPHHGKTKPWKRHKKYIRHIHKYPRVNVRLGFNHRWPLWTPNLCTCQHSGVVVVNHEKEIDSTVEEIITQIEDLAVLKGKGLITEKEYEKAKKDLLKRI